MRILQVDYMGCLYWHYHAKDANPAWEFTKRLRDIIDRFKVDKTLLLLEGGSSYRETLHPGYKGERKKRNAEQPEAEKKRHAAFKKEANKWANDVAPLLGIVPVWVRGAEADDLAGYLCNHIDTKEHQILNLSGDQDWYQFLRTNVVQASYDTIQKTEKGEPIPASVWLSQKKFEETYGIPVSQWIWKKCMTGDSGDSVPGFPMLGNVTALKLLQKYGSISEIEARKDTLDVPRFNKQAKQAMAEDFSKVHTNYQLMNLNHTDEQECAIFGTNGIPYLDFVIKTLPIPTVVQQERLIELSYERGFLEIDGAWLRPFHFYKK